MNSQSTSPDEIGQFGLLKDDGHFSQYVVNQQNEIVYIFRSLIEKGDLVSASFDHGKHIMLTVIVGVDPLRGLAFLDFGSIEAQNQKILHSDKIIFVTSHDKVKIQFATNKIEKTVFDSRDAFKIKLPDSLIRLQRREYYRLQLPAFTPLKCAIPIADDYVMAEVVDISLGGIKITLPPMETAFELGTILAKCKMELPDIGLIEADLKICNISEVTLKSGLKNHRAGCGFINLSQRMQGMIQRFLIHVERKLRAMELERE